MYIPIDTGSGVPIYLQIIDGIKYAIAMGSVQPGDQVPSVRELSAQLRVNPNTVMKALRELEHQGVIFIKRGMGAFVTDSGASITKKERERIISELLRKAISQAAHFQISPEQLEKMIKEEMKKIEKYKS